MTTIQFDIKTCSDCPFVDSQRVYTADSYENVHEYWCTKKRNRKIAQIDSFDKMPEVPEWCPIKVKQ
jgi:hypothetical protein